MTQMPSFDYRGLKCPLPVLKARRALAQLSTGEVIEFWLMIQHHLLICHIFVKQKAINLPAPIQWKAILFITLSKGRRTSLSSSGHSSEMLA